MISIIFALLCLGCYLAGKPKHLYNPANFVFIFFALYLLLPVLIFWIFEFFQIKYILPWGKLNDWTKLNFQSVIDFVSVFFIYFLLFKLVIPDKVMGSMTSIKFEKIRFSKLKILVSVTLTFGLAFYYFQATGGASAWLTSYSKTYLENRAGLGFYNLVLLWCSNFFAFTVGIILFKIESKNFKIIIAILISLICFTAFLQGIKSRIPYYLFFALSPVLMFSQLSLLKSIAIFSGFLGLFSFGMYFRSDGFYNTFHAAIEYYMSYFNLVFLHDKIVQDLPSMSFFAVGMGAFKYLELLGQYVPRTSYDLSVKLTSIYFPSDWFNESATVQWPLSTELYLSFPSKIFWVISISIHCFWFRLLILWTKKDPFFLYVFLAELIRIMSTMRSSLLPWDLPLTLVSYVWAFLIWRFIRSDRRRI